MEHGGDRFGQRADEVMAHQSKVRVEMALLGTEFEDMVRVGRVPRQPWSILGE